MPICPPFTLANASWVTDRLAVGGDLAYDDDLAVEQALELADAGITHLVDVRSEASDEELVAEVAPGITYIHAGVDDLGQRIPPAWFERIVTFAETALATPGTKVFIHCHMGINRAPSAMMAVLLSQGYEAVEALRMLRAARPIAYVDYAADAVRWHATRTHASRADVARTLAAIALWRVANHMDPEHVIRLVREQEARDLAALQQKLEPQAG